MIAKKLIETKKEGEYEIKKFHVIEIKEFSWKNFDIICDKFSLYDLDGEDAVFNYGICFDFDGEIFSIEATKFIEGVKEYLHDDSYDLEEEHIKEIFAFLEALEKYKGYDIY
jgi:hypothetical protein